jgi:hypothetical protein
MRKCSGNLGLGDFYSGRVKVITCSALVNSRISCVEAGSNTSTVTLRVVRGDEKGSLKSETVKYGYESKGARTQERLRWRVPAAYTRQTRPLVREDAHKNSAVIVKD